MGTVLGTHPAMFESTNLGGEMLFRQFYEPTSSTLSYLVARREGGAAVLIDPVREDLEVYLKVLRDQRLQLSMAIDTHVHADHVTALGTLREQTGCLTAMGAQSRAECVSARISDGEVIDVDGLELRALYTPGHTDDSYSFVMSDRVFTGDTLLIGGTGRTDFQNGSAREAYDSLFNRLLRLDDRTLVYPGHDYKGRRVSTIGEERRGNPRLQVRSAEEYAELMAKLDLPRPKQMDLAVPANLRCGLA
jgi:glyoxylase-like metal-dependent hydrolase (beta-lactamase superfamily II)